MSEKAELARCPFCGGKATMQSQLRYGYADCPDDIAAHAYYARCLPCAAEGPWAKSESGAIRLWNHRA